MSPTLMLLSSLFLQAVICFSISALAGYVLGRVDWNDDDQKDVKSAIVSSDTHKSIFSRFADELHIGNKDKN